MLNRLVTVLIFIPLAIVLVALAVANRAPVAFTIDPFNPGNPGLTLSLPLAPGLAETITEFVLRGR